MKITFYLARIYTWEMGAVNDPVYRRLDASNLESAILEADARFDALDTGEEYLADVVHVDVRKVGQKNWYLVFDVM